jgi:1-acyl-sn-glycerol-3-phosphate acyltransferase
MPNASIRRPLTVTLWLLLSIATLALSPLLLGLAAIASALTGRPQAMIVTRLLIAYFVRELVTLLGCAALWVMSGGGVLIRTRPFRLLHWRVLSWFVHGLAERAMSVLDVELAQDPAPAPTGALHGDQPVIVFSRHAGPGDTMLLIDQLLDRFDRRPSVVFKQDLILDPCIDLLAHRLPHVVLDTGDPVKSQEQLETAVARLDSRGVLLLFPEGGNFTPQRRRAAVAHLRRRGRRRAAAAAESMSHVLPPRPSGALAVLRGNDSADVIFAAHTGLGLAAYPRQLWQQMPIGKTLRTRMWLVPRSGIPDEPDEQVAWLNDWWKRIDDWIDQQGTEPQPGIIDPVANTPA